MCKVNCLYILKYKWLLHQKSWASKIVIRLINITLEFFTISVWYNIPLTSSIDFFCALSIRSILFYGKRVVESWFFFYFKTILWPSRTYLKIYLETENQTNILYDMYLICNLVKSKFIPWMIQFEWYENLSLFLQYVK